MSFCFSYASPHLVQLLIHAGALPQEVHYVLLLCSLMIKSIKSGAEFPIQLFTVLPLVSWSNIVCIMLACQPATAWAPAQSTEALSEAVCLPV